MDMFFKRRHVLGKASIMLAALLLAQPTQAETCAEIKQITSAAGSGWTGLHGRKIDEFEGDATYEASVFLAEAQKCKVAYLDGDPVYECVWHFADHQSSNKAYDSLKDRLRQCLGLGRYDPINLTGNGKRLAHSLLPRTNGDLIFRMWAQ